MKNETILYIQGELGFCKFSILLKESEQTLGKYKFIFLECLTPELENYFYGWVKVCFERENAPVNYYRGCGLRKVIMINDEVFSGFVENINVIESEFIMPIELEFHLDKMKTEYVKTWLERRDFISP